MKRTSLLHRLTETGLIAALYAVLTLVLPVASFGTVQFRFSEMLTVLPVFSKNAVAGLTLGCAIANAIGVAMGVNIAGVWDILIGAFATWLAAVATRALRRVTVKGLPVLAVWPPVLVNAVIIGAELCAVTVGTLHWPLFGVMALQVALGQLLPCVVGGIFLHFSLEKTQVAAKIFRNT